MVESDLKYELTSGVALPFINEAPYISQIFSATNLASYLGAGEVCLYVFSCSSSIITKPIFFSGAKTALRAPIIILILLSRILFHTSNFSPSEILLCHIAISSGLKRLISLSVNCDASAISGARNRTFFPVSNTFLIVLKYISVLPRACYSIY